MGHCAIRDAAIGLRPRCAVGRKHTPQPGGSTGSAVVLIVRRRTCRQSILDASVISTAAGLLRVYIRLNPTPLQGRGEAHDPLRLGSIATGGLTRLPAEDGVYRGGAGPP